jgi:hypothetical protein
MRCLPRDLKVNTMNSRPSGSPELEEGSDARRAAAVQNLQTVHRGQERKAE